MADRKCLNEHAEPLVIRLERIRGNGATFARPIRSFRIKPDQKQHVLSPTSRKRSRSDAFASRSRRMVKSSSKGLPSDLAMPPDLAGFAVFALIVMGLLTLGYSRKSSVETAQVPPPVAGGSMAQPVGTADKPKLYQPVNPAPDPRSAPTTSDTGTGPDKCGRPEDQPKR